jgi:hypothetical protein
MTEEISDKTIMTAIIPIKLLGIAGTGRSWSSHFGTLGIKMPFTFK